MANGIDITELSEHADANLHKKNQQFPLGYA